MRTLRIVIIDRNEITRKGIQALIGDADPAFSVAAACGRLREADACLRDQNAEMVIVDDTTLHPLEVTRLAARCESQGIGIIVISQRRDRHYIQQVMAHGSASFIIRSGDPAGELLAAIRLMAEHRPFLSAEALRLLGGQRDSRLAERDLEVLRLLEHELSVQEIAQRLGLSDKTIYRIRHKLKRTLGVRNTESVVDAARRQGLLDTRE